LGPLHDDAHHQRAAGGVAESSEAGIMFLTGSAARHQRAGAARHSALAKTDLTLASLHQAEDATRVLREGADTLGGVPGPFNAARARMVPGHVLPPHQAFVELQVSLRVLESLEALPERVDILSAMSAAMAQHSQHGKARALSGQALELLPSWHGKAGEIRRAVRCAGGAAEQ
jgi:hypothetical protein